MRALAFVAILLAASIANPQTVLLISGGRYFVVNVDSGSVPTVKEVTKVVNVDGGTPKPPVTNPDTVRGKVKSLAEQAGEPLMARALAEGVYNQIAKHLESGLVDWKQAQALISAASDVAIGESEKKAAWGTWRSKLGEIIDDLQRQGKLETKEQQLQFLEDVASGLQDSAKGAALDLDRLLEIIDKLIPFIKLIISLFGGGAQAPMGG